MLVRTIAVVALIAEICIIVEGVSMTVFGLRPFWYVATPALGVVRITDL